MKLVNPTGKLSKKYGDIRTLEILADAGFDGYDYTMCDMEYDEHFLNCENYMEHIAAVKKHADDLGILCTQAHALFPPQKDGIIFDRLVRSLEIAAYLGAECIVIHPITELCRHYQTVKDDLFRENMDFYRSIIPYAKQYGIKIAVENMWGWDVGRETFSSSTCSHSDEFCKYIDTLDSEYITACLYLGHCALVSDDPANMIYKLGKRIRALHVHDVDLAHDNHTLPYVGAVNWDSVCEALAKINYIGNLTFEANGFLSEYMDDDFIPVAVKYMEQVGRSLIRKIEGYKRG